MRPKRDLLRVVRGQDGSIVIDPTGRLPGRGAYLCRDTACWELAARKRSLDHAFKAPVPESVLAVLAADPIVEAATTEPVQRAVPGAPNTASDQGGGPHGSK